MQDLKISPFGSERWWCVLFTAAIVMMTCFGGVAQAQAVQVGYTDDMATRWDSEGIATGAAPITFREPTNLRGSLKIKKLGIPASAVPVNHTYDWTPVNSIETLETHRHDDGPYFAFGGFLINGGKWGGKGWTSNSYPKANAINLAPGEYINFVAVTYGDWIAKVDIRTNRGKSFAIGGSGGSHTVTLENIRVTRLKCTTAGEYDIPQNLWVEYYDDYPERDLSGIEVLAHTAKQGTYVAQRSTTWAFARPTDFVEVWNDSGSGAETDGACWRPVPPAGYVSLGDVFVSGHGLKPDLTSVVCVHSSLVVYGTIGSKVWDTTGAGTVFKRPDAFSAWEIEAPSGALPLGAFVGASGMSRPSRTVYCLKKSALVERTVEGVASVTMLQCRDTTDPGEDEIYFRVHADGYFLGKTSYYDINESDSDDSDWWYPGYEWIFDKTFTIELWENDYPQSGDDKIGAITADIDMPHGTVEGSFTGDGGDYWFQVRKAKRFSKVTIDESLTRPQKPVARNMGNGAWLHNVLTFDKNGFRGQDYSQCANAPWFHVQNVARLPNKGDHAYIVATHSDAYLPGGGGAFEHWYPGDPRGYMTIYKAPLDRSTDLIRKYVPGGVHGKIIYEETFQNGAIATESGNSSRGVGTWNHPCNIDVLGNLMIISMQDWDGSDICRDGYDRGSKDALLFYDVRDPERPQYWGRITAAELGIPSVEDAGLVQLADRWILIAGSAGNASSPTRWWWTERVSPSIESWTYGGEGTFGDMGQGGFINSYEIYDPPSSAPDGTIAQGLPRAIFGNGDSKQLTFAFSTLNFGSQDLAAAVGFVPSNTADYLSRGSMGYGPYSVPNLWITLEEGTSDAFKKDYDTCHVSVHGGRPVIYAAHMHTGNGMDRIYQIERPASSNWYQDTSWRSRIKEWNTEGRITFSDPAEIGVGSVGLDECLSGSRRSTAPVFPEGFERLPSSRFASVVGDSTFWNGDSRYSRVEHLHDGTGMVFGGHPDSEKGWIPGGDLGLKNQAIFTLSRPTRLAGIDFLTKQLDRTLGTFQFLYRVNGSGVDDWKPITTVINRDVNGAAMFRLGLRFFAIEDVIAVKLRTTSTFREVYVGEVNLYEERLPAHLAVTDPAGLGLDVVGVDVNQMGSPVEDSAAPSFPTELGRVPGVMIQTAGDDTDNPAYASSRLNDDTGYTYQRSAGGWIPGGEGNLADTAILTPAGPIDLGGIDFVCPLLAIGSFEFSYSIDGGTSYRQITKVTSSANRAFRLGLKFDTIDNVTNVKLTTTSGLELGVCVGEVDLYEVPPTDLSFSDPLARGIVESGRDVGGGRRPSNTPTFPDDHERVPDADITVSGDGTYWGGDPNYAVTNLNDGSGYWFSAAPEVERGWIPGGEGDTPNEATLTLSKPTTLAGIDFLTLYGNRTRGVFVFDCQRSGDAATAWTPITTVRNGTTSTFRLGLTFAPIADVTRVRIRTASAAEPIYIGEIDLYRTPDRGATSLESEALALWAFDEGTGTTGANSNQAAHAVSIVHGAWTDGRSGKALGGSAVTDDLLPTLTECTVSAWVRRDGAGEGYPCIVGWDNYGLEIWEQGASGLVWIYIPGMGGWLQTGQFLDGGWNHIAVAAGNGSATAYFNGVPVGTLSGSLTVQGKLYMGGRLSSQLFNGAIDDVVVLDRVLTADEIASLAGEAEGTRYQRAILADAPLAYWTMDEDSGTVIADVVGGNQGTIVGGTTPGHASAPGLGTSLRFNGDGHVSIPDSDSLDITSSFTIEMWVQRDSVNDYGWLMEKKPYAWMPFLAGAGAPFYGGGYQPSYEATALPVPAGQWTHIAYVKNNNGVADNWRGYVNGVEFFRMSRDFTLAETTGELVLGTYGSYDNAAYRLKGFLDEVAIYGHALTADQVLSHYNAGMAGN